MPLQILVLWKPATSRSSVSNSGLEWRFSHGRMSSGLPITMMMDKQ
jgi:hypothetical protein